MGSSPKEGCYYVGETKGSVGVTRDPGAKTRTNGRDKELSSDCVLSTPRFITIVLQRLTLAFCVRVWLCETTITKHLMMS